MTKKPIIGIVSKPNKYDIKRFQNQIIYEKVRCAILNNNGLTIGVLPTQKTDNFYEGETKFDKTVLTSSEKKDLYQIIDLCDDIVLEGGLSSASYEYEVVKYAIKKDIPLLGICAGFNNIVRALDGGVFQHKKDTRHNIEKCTIAHKNIIKEDTLLYSILKTKEISVNSIHTLFAKEDNIKNLEISAYSDDGYVEAVELKNKKFFLGVKWHPELMLDDKRMNNIFKRFIDTCSKK